MAAATEDSGEATLPLPMGEIDLQEKAKELGIKYFLVNYFPLNADSRASLIPAEVIGHVQRHGYGVHMCMYYDIPAIEPESFILPDPRSLIQLPWKPEIGWLASNLYLKGRPWAQCPRRALIRQIERAKRLGYVLKSGFEPEFSLLNKDGTALADGLDGKPMALQEPLLTLRQAPFLVKVHEAMRDLGWKPFQFEHEAANCQYEITYEYSEALTTADRHAFMKFMVKQIASEEGYTASFMPMPLPDLLCANGLHVHVSLWSTEDKTNIFRDDSGKFGLSETAYHFLAGLIKHAESCTALLCPTVNSYKRINNASWSPNRVSWGGNNRTVLFRVPANDRIENRMADGAANPYLLVATILAAGLDGIETKADPGDMCEGDPASHPERYKQLPLNLLDAMRSLAANDYIKKQIGEELVDAFLKRKKDEWDISMKQYSQWEKDYYINC